jgi:transcriptional regulator with XRE-family HTH domain
MTEKDAQMKQYYAKENVSLIEVALKYTGWKQNELAKRLKVSETQITRWKQGERMPSDREQQIRKVAKVSTIHTDWADSAGSAESLEKWRNFIMYLAREAQRYAEDNDGFSGPTQLTDGGEDDHDCMCAITSNIVKDMGFKWPKTFPAELNFDYDHFEKDDLDDENWEKENERIHDAVHSNPIARVIENIFKAYNDMYHYCERSGVFALIHDDRIRTCDMSEVDSAAEQLDDCLLRLSAAKINDDVAPNSAAYKKFRQETLHDYMRWIKLVKEEAWKEKVPIPVELADLLNKSHGELGAEAEFAGIKRMARDRGLVEAEGGHPDIYMNRLLEGMEMIHKVLPAIMTKIGMSGEEIDAVVSGRYAEWLEENDGGKRGPSSLN